MSCSDPGIGSRSGCCSAARTAAPRASRARVSSSSRVPKRAKLSNSSNCDKVIRTSPATERKAGACALGFAGGRSVLCSIFGRAAGGVAGLGGVGPQAADPLRPRAAGGQIVLEVRGVGTVDHVINGSVIRGGVHLLDGLFQGLAGG